jgi:NAD(P)H-dependent flavin oxidoreductase YrpB (nitropropane dioxygenase family)
MTTQNIFGSAYPIVAMAMNRVSDLKLAIAIKAAGAVPSLSLYNYYISPTVINDKLLEKDLDAYTEKFGDADLFLSLGVEEILDARFPRLITKYKVKFLEVVQETNLELVHRGKTPNPQREVRATEIINKLRENGTLVFVKALVLSNIEEKFMFDGVIIKSADAAGRSGNLENEGITSLGDFLNKIKNKFPALHVIVSGGISTSKQVKELVDAGAAGIGIGTLFAAALESKVSLETKLKMINSTSADIQPLKSGARQNALVFAPAAAGTFNNTRGLAEGVKSPKAGHIFVGKGIDNVTAVLPVNDIVQSLVKDL